MKTLYFEGAGWAGADRSKATDVGNCRIRTAFTNKDGNKIYLELSQGENWRHSEPKHYVHEPKYYIHIDFCFIITGERDECEKQYLPLQDQSQHRTPYNNASILKLVNHLGGDFGQVETLHDLAGYRVHGEQGRYNAGDEFDFNPDKTAKRQAIHSHFYKLEKSEGKRYPNFSLWVDGDDSNKLHLLRHFNGYNKHWEIDISKDDCIGSMEQTPLYSPGAYGIAK